MAIKKRFCENCDGVNSGGFYDDICIIQELKEYEQYLFDNEKWIENEGFNGDYGCQVPAKVWREINQKYGESDCNFAICDALNQKKRNLKE